MKEGGILEQQALLMQKKSHPERKHDSRVYQELGSERQYKQTSGGKKEGSHSVVRGGAKSGNMSSLSSFAKV